MNFVFISPHFPHTYWQFCDRLKHNGVNVLGIGDAPYDTLEDNLKRSLTEYYYVQNMENYDDMFRAVAYFSFKYGKIDWLESNNEYWLESDARLRTDFHITTGIGADEIIKFKSKAAMKPYYKKAGVPSARQLKIPAPQDVADDKAAAALLRSVKAFVKKVGFPVFAKPEIGVGASDTFKMNNQEEVENFLNVRPGEAYVMEEFIDANICSYDAITDADANPLMESMGVFPPSIAEIVKKNLDLCYYVADEMDPKLREAGRATVKAFGAKSRYVHLEFFRLNEDKEGLGKKGDFLGLEVNMRPAGGYTPDMVNFAHSIDVYQIWADMVTYNERRFPVADKEYFCAYAGRRDGTCYVHTEQELMEKYGPVMVMHEENPPMMWPQMSRYMYDVKLTSLKEVEEFFHFATDRK